MAKKVTLTQWLQSSIIRIARAHFVFVGLYAVYIIAADATGLITADALYERWLVNLALLVTAATVWYGARFQNNNPNFYRGLLYILIMADIVFAMFNVYTQRGMASRAVILFLIPIIVSAVLLSRTALYTTAILAVAGYVLVSVKYFTDYFNEGYKAELYTEVGFYCGVFLLAALLLTSIIKFSQSSKKL